MKWNHALGNIDAFAVRYLLVDVLGAHGFCAHFFRHELTRYWDHQKENLFPTTAREFVFVLSFFFFFLLLLRPNAWASFVDAFRPKNRVRQQTRRRPSCLTAHKYATQYFMYMYILYTLRRCNVCYGTKCIKLTRCHARDFAVCRVCSSVVQGSRTGFCWA